MHFPLFLNTIAKESRAFRFVCASQNLSRLVPNKSFFNGPLLFAINKEVVREKHHNSVRWKIALLIGINLQSHSLSMSYDKINGADIKTA